MKIKTFSMPYPYMRTIGVCMFIISMLTACFKSGATTDDIPVSLHGVNYSDQEFSYSLEDPNDKSNIGGGETIDRYGAGGTMCCYSLPKKWQPGLKVKVDTTHWFTSKPDNTLKDVHESYVVDIPSYAKPSEIWVLREPDGKSTIVVSDFQPNHPNWPGAIKGWPVPSLPYRRERWDIYIKQEEGNIRSAQKFLDTFKENPNQAAKKSWDFAMEYNQISLNGFAGYDDKKYQEFLRNDYEKWRNESIDKAKHLKGERP